ncbi:c6 zinc finger domain containing protein [Grosmannia clavigera kw1407]|uniref:C6 zinc finger domain containing protein n=1 Tax=Grosmannia clavigera (strain kw1407 / UAMH 11150) TaxID=655863 RepID=F0X898_GROCL|nr:c6 zinc finger domain containing protein [Grosmannia clavigera kw1407]EFX05474.1 c6 zinc finger domain containing protein [Grosmannia clavigera kw1407]
MQSFFQHRRLREAAKTDVDKLHAHGDSPAASQAASEANFAEEGKLQRAQEHSIAGVNISDPSEYDGSTTYEVGWADGDPENPQNWSLVQKWSATTTVSFILLAVSIPSSIDAPVSDQFNKHYGVGPIAGSMTTGMYLIGIGVGSMVAAPFSETFGRNLVYLTTMVIFILFTIGKALAPNYGAAIVFRFFAGFFGAAPLTVGSGTVADIWGPLEITFSLPFVTLTSYGGPILGPIISAYLPDIGYRWADWISAIFAGVILILVFLFQPETYSPTLLEWRASHLCELTGDPRFCSQGHASAGLLGRRLLTNMLRPFSLTYTEPIILVFSFYLTILYIVLFTFLNGFPFIFGDTYGISNSLTFLIFTALLVGDFVAILLIPIVYGWTKKASVRAADRGQNLAPEVCLYFAMLGGSILMPISIFWIGWTCYPSVSIWVPIIGVVVFGYSLVTVFTTTYNYIVFVYLQYAGSALSFMTFSRYVISGALLPASVPMYKNLGPHFTLTWVGVLAALMAPLPFLLYKYGHQIRAMSKNVQNQT